MDPRTLHQNNMAYPVPPEPTTFDPRRRQFSQAAAQHKLEHNVVERQVDGFQVFFMDLRNYLGNMRDDEFVQHGDEFRKQVIANAAKLEKEVYQRLEHPRSGGKPLSHVQAADDGRPHYENIVRPYVLDAVRDVLRTMGQNYYKQIKWQPNRNRNYYSDPYDMSDPGDAFQGPALNVHTDWSAKDFFISQEEAAAIRRMPPEDIAKWVAQKVARTASQHTSQPYPKGDNPFEQNDHYLKLISDTIHAVKRAGARTETIRVPVVVKYTTTQGLTKGSASSHALSPFITMYVPPGLGDSDFIETMAHEFGHMLYASLDKEAQDKLYDLARGPLQVTNYGKVTTKGLISNTAHMSGNEWLAEFISWFAKTGRAADHELTQDENKVVAQVRDALRFTYSPHRGMSYRGDKSRAEEEDVFKRRDNRKEGKLLLIDMIDREIKKFFKDFPIKVHDFSWKLSADFAKDGETDFRKVKRKVHQSLSGGMIAGHQFKRIMSQLGDDNAKEVIDKAARLRANVEKRGPTDAVFAALLKADPELKDAWEKARETIKTAQAEVHERSAELERQRNELEASDDWTHEAADKIEQERIKTNEEWEDWQTFRYTFGAY